MAQFKLELPQDLIKQFDSLEKNSKKMLEEMTRAGAQVVYENIKANVPATWYGSDIMNCLRITKSYNTPTDDGINTKVGFYGYFTNADGKKTPAPLVANVTEYGRSTDKAKKHPFLRKSFRKSQIESAMLKAQNKYIKG